MKLIQTRQRIITLFENMVADDQNIHNAHLLVHSDSYQLHLNLTSGDGRINVEDPVCTDQPVYMASVGKTFTATLIALLCEQHMLGFHQRIVEFLDSELINGLHVYKGKEYTDRIQIRHLLNHTSGLPDYFEDQPIRGKRMVERITLEPERMYQPVELVLWTKENLKSKFPPGEGFHYSDTGYHLLGLVIEAVTGKPFQDVLSHLIFEPLGMKRAFLIGHSQPCETSPHPIAGVYFGKINIAGYRSLSMDHAGGGITAPLEDMLIFMQALVQGRLLRGQIFNMMEDCVRFAPGIDYGYGMMKIRPVPLLMPARYSCWGNAGSTSAFMFYHPGLDATLIGCMNQFRYHRKGILFMLRAIDGLYKEIF